MFEKIKNLLNFNEEQEEENIIYKKASDLGKESEYDVIPKLDIPHNDKKTILILDDNEQAGNLTLLDLRMLDSIAEKMRATGLKDLSNKQKSFVEQLPNKQLEQLNKLNLEDYNIIIATGTMAAFSVYEAIDAGLKVDYAILDILIGGHNIYSDKGCILDGIDVSNKLYGSNPEIKYNFYSGCSLAEDSDETIKYNKLMRGDLNSCVIVKDKNLDQKRQKLIELFI